MRHGRVDYRMARRAAVREVRDGLTPVDSVCDAHPELVRAGRIPVASPAELRGMAIAEFLAESVPALRDAGVVVEEVGTPAEYTEADEPPVILGSEIETPKPEGSTIGAAMSPQLGP